MNGRELSDAVVSRRPGVKLLYTSGYTDNAIIHHGRLNEGVLLLSKPYRKSHLAHMVRKALDAPGGAANKETKGSDSIATEAVASLPLPSRTAQRRRSRS